MQNQFYQAILCVQITFGASKKSFVIAHPLQLDGHLGSIPFCQRTDPELICAVPAQDILHLVGIFDIDERLYILRRHFLCSAPSGFNDLEPETSDSY